MDNFKRTAQKKAGCGRWTCKHCGPQGHERVTARRAARRKLKRVDYDDYNATVTRIGKGLDL